MKCLTEHLWFETPHRRDYLNITDSVEALVRKSSVQEGLCLVNAMHITASVYINDAEDGLLHDYDARSEEHTSELQSPCNLVCRLLLEKKKNNIERHAT